MCNRNRTSCFNLFTEQWNNRTIAAQYITESDSYKLCLCCFKGFLYLYIYIFILCQMRKKLRDLICFSRLDLGIKRLNDHFAQTLARAHDICRINSLIRTDQHKSFAAMCHGSKGCLIRTNDIIFDRFTRTVFHKRYMLVCGRMIYDIRMELFKYLKNLSAVPDRTDDRFQMHIRIIFPKFHLDVIRIIFIYVKNNQCFRLMCGDLSAKF